MDEPIKTAEELHEQYLEAISLLPRYHPRDDVRLVYTKKVTPLTIDFSNWEEVVSLLELHLAPRDLQEILEIHDPFQTAPLIFLSEGTYDSDAIEEIEALIKEPLWFFD